MLNGAQIKLFVFPGCVWFLCLGAAGDTWQTLMMHHFLLAFWVLFESWFTSVSVWHLLEFKINLWHQSEEPANNVFCNRRTQIFYLTSCPCVFVMQTWRYQTVWSYLPVSKGATRLASANSTISLKTFWALVSPPEARLGFTSKQENISNILSYHQVWICTVRCVTARVLFLQTGYQEGWRHVVRGVSPHRDILAER